jgi:hypothetical protein
VPGEILNTNPKKSILFLNILFFYNKLVIQKYIFDACISRTLMGNQMVSKVTTKNPRWICMLQVLGYVKDETYAVHYSFSIQKIQKALQKAS